MNDEETAAKGRRARAEYRETEGAFAKLRKAALDELVKTSPENTAKILKLHMTAQTLSAVQEALMRVVQAGEYAEQALAQAGLNRA